MTTDRLAEGRVNYLLVSLAALGTTLPLFLIAAFVGWDVGFSLTLAGLVLAFTIPVAFEYRANRTRPRNVQFLDYRRHHYGSTIANACDTHLRRSDRQWTFEYLRPASATGVDSKEFQLTQLREAVNADVDAVVILADGQFVDRVFWQTVVHCQNAGIAIVVLEPPPPREVFEDQGLDPPFFVTSDYCAGGELIAGAIAHQLQTDSQSRALLLVGPRGSWSGEERSRQMLMRLILDGYQERFDILPISDWCVTEGRCKEIVEALNAAPTTTRWVIYAADDEHALALHRYLVNETTDLRDRTWIIGYDASGVEFGSIPAFEFGAAEATIDVDVGEQGREVARYLVGRRLGRVRSSRSSVLVAPRLILLSDYLLTR